MIRIVLATLGLAACAPAADIAAPDGAAGQSIRYETGPCFGSCPVYTVTVASDGTGVFTGQRFTAAIGERRFTVTPAEYAAFADLLGRHLPASGTVDYAQGTANCPNAPTDMPSARASRTIAAQPPRTSAINFYYGCSRDNPDLADALRRAPEMLPIAALIGDRKDFTGKR